LTELAGQKDAAQEALDTAENENTRTPVATARCKEVFVTVVEFMRDFKRRFFLSPPLTDADLRSLGLWPRDKHPTKTGVPTAQVTVETFYVGPHVLGERIVYVAGDPHDRANKSYQIWYHVAEPGEEAPTHPDQLDKLLATQRK
jgi:hypothetical protein